MQELLKSLALIEAQIKNFLNEDNQSSADISNNPNFKRWFKDSKVVDSQGNPLVVYHGTGKKFNKFNKSKTVDSAFWFTSSERKLLSGEAGAAGSGDIIPVYLYARNLAGWEEYEKWTYDEIISAGYDGIQLDDDYIVFEPNQIKSIYNNGNFSITSDNIFESDNQSYPPPKQVMQNPNFKRWFGDSKVVDSQGNPLVVYHGTLSQFDEFLIHDSKFTQLKGQGVYFTDNPAYASKYAQKGGATGGSVTPCYLSINNPRYLDNAELRELRMQYGAGSDLSNPLIEQGYDGVIFTDSNGDKEYVIFNPKQAKSIYNNGEFNPNTAKISEDAS